MAWLMFLLGRVTGLFHGSREAIHLLQELIAWLRFWRKCMLDLPFEDPVSVEKEAVMERYSII